MDVSIVGNLAGTRTASLDGHQDHQRKTATFGWLTAHLSPDAPPDLLDISKYVWSAEEAAVADRQLQEIDRVRSPLGRSPG